MLVVCYVAAFYFLSLTLRVIPVGIAYAIWSALWDRIDLRSRLWVFFRQKLDLAAVIGLGLIIAGVLVVNLFFEIRVTLDGCRAIYITLYVI